MLYNGTRSVILKNRRTTDTGRRSCSRRTYLLKNGLRGAFWSPFPVNSVLCANLRFERDVAFPIQNSILKIHSCFGNKIGLGTKTIEFRCSGHRPVYNPIRPPAAPFGERVGHAACVRTVRRIFVSSSDPSFVLVLVSDTL